MRIVHLITRLIVGGAQENTLLTCEGLTARGHEVTLLSGPTTGPEGSLEGRARKGGYRFEIVAPLVREVRPLDDRRAYGALCEKFALLRPDVVHTHSSKAGVLGRLAAARARAPVVVHTIHGMSFNRTQRWPVRIAYAAAERFCAKRTHALVSVADAMTKQALAAGVGRAEQYQTIRSGIVLSEFDPAKHERKTARAVWGFDDHAIVVGTVARLFRNKGYEQLIEVIHRSLRGEPRLRFLWIGDGADRQRYEAELSLRGLREKVVLAGLLPPEQLPGALAAIDLLAHTSQWEGLPRAVVQALLMGKPAVCFEVDGAPEVVLDGRTGRLAPLGDLDGFANAVLELARDEPRRSRMGKVGQALCRGLFDHDEMVRSLDVLYRCLLDQATRSGSRPRT